MHTTVRYSVPAAALAAVALGLAGCASDTSATPQAADGAGAPERPTLTVGALPFAQTAPIHLAIEEGFFEDEGLDVQLTDSVGGGATLISGLVAGSIDITYSNFPSLVQARSQGLPVQVIRGNDEPSGQAIFVMPDSEIEESADLAGRTIAITALGNISEITTRAVLGEAGVDQDDLEFVELDMPSMLSALESGQVDAAWLVEPFITLAQQSLGVREVMDAFEGPTDGLPVAGWATTTMFAEQNPNTVAAFVRAIDTAVAYATENEDEARAIVGTYTEIPADTLSAMEFPTFATADDLAKLQTYQDLMLEYGFIDTPFDNAELIP